MKIINSVQKWMPFDKFLDNGIIKLKNNSYIKILKIIPINFNLKSDLEKQAILNSYKIFLKTINSDIQILIQSNKENLSKHISQINENISNQCDNKIIALSQNYIQFIEDLNQLKKSSSKNFFILLKKFPQNKKREITKEQEKLIINNLNEDYIMVKECIMRCGNRVYELQNNTEIKKFVKSFFAE